MLAAAFRRAASGRFAETLSASELEAKLAALCALGRARWPQVTLSPEDVAAAAGVRVKSDAELSDLHAADLYLAAACALGVRGAVDSFERELLSAASLSTALRRIDGSAAFVEEVRQAVREKLFVPPPGRIAEYSGRGPLAAWTRVVAVRVALDLRPRHREEQHSEDAAVAAERDPELRYLQQKYKEDFEEATKAAFLDLDDEQVNLLRLQLVDGLQTAQIASLFRVDRSTIKRRLAACRETLLLRTRAALQERLGVSPESFASLSRLLASQLHVSVERLLQERS
jgi:RNA polymerase sigma-70 factor (ECF subfamily)